MTPYAFDDWEYLGNDLQTYTHSNVKAGEKNVDQIQQFAELLKLIEEALKAEFEHEISQRYGSEAVRCLSGRDFYPC